MRTCERGHADGAQQAGLPPTLVHGEQQGEHDAEHGDDDRQREQPVDERQALVDEVAARVDELVARLQLADAVLVDHRVDRAAQLGRR